MDRRGITQTALAREALVSQDSVRKWRQGRVLPSLASAAIMADALMDDGLIRLAAEARTRTCQGCGRPFVLLSNTGPRFGVWCGMRCRQREHERRRRPVESVERRERNGRELALYRDRLARHCATCEPSGVCLTPECDLRDVSPLPLVRERAA